MHTKSDLTYYTTAKPNGALTAYPFLVYSATFYLFDSLLLSLFAAAVRG